MLLRILYQNNVKPDTQCDRETIVKSVDQIFGAAETQFKIKFANRAYNELVVDLEPKQILELRRYMGEKFRELNTQLRLHTGIFSPTRVAGVMNSDFKNAGSTEAIFEVEIATVENEYAEPLQITHHRP